MKTWLAIPLFAFTVAAVTTAPMAAAGSFSAGFDVSDEASAEDTGMKSYPGATKVSRKKKDNDSINLQLSLGDFGLKVVAATMFSADPPEKIAAFYREELARYGDVLDCGAREPVISIRISDKKSRPLACDGEKPRKDGMVYKAGSRDNHRVVHVRTRGEGTEFSLVHINVRNAD